jgi:uncharacterized membrane protein YgcG
MAYDQSNSELKRTKIKMSKNDVPYNYCYVEIKGQLYRINVSECQKDTRKDNDGDYWVKITKTVKNGGGGGNGGGNRSAGNTFGGGGRRSSNL